VIRRAGFAVDHLLHRVPAPSTGRVVVALAFVSFAVALLAARVQGPAGPWLWNLDIPKIDYPLAVFFHDSLAAGRLPLWNDQLGLGFPLYAEGQIGAFYPPNWLIFQLPPLTALDVSRVLHLTIAGVGAGCLVLRICGSRAGAFVAALVAVLGGAITAKLEWHNLVTAYAYVPWVLLPLVRRPAPRRVGLVGAGVLFGVQALAGHPNTWLLTGFAAALVLFFTRPRPVTIFRILAFGIIGVAVGAVQLIPTAVVTTLSVRSQPLSATDLFTSASTPFDVLGLAFQGAFVRVDATSWNPYTVWYPDGAFALYEAAVYVGLPVVALAAVAITARRVRPLVIAILVLIAIPVIAAFRPEIWMTTPILDALRSPTRSYMVVGLLLGVLAGVGVGRLGRSRGAGRRATIAVALLGVAYAVTLSLAELWPSAFDQVLLASSSFLGPGDVERQRQLAIGVLTRPWPLAADVAAGIVILVVLGIARLGGPRLLLAPLGLLAAAAPLVVLGPLPNGTRPMPDFSYAGTDFVEAVRDVAPYRFLTLSPPGYYAGIPDQLAAAGVADLRMFSSLNLLATESVTQDAGRDDATSLRRALGVDTVATFDRPCAGQLLTRVDAEHAAVCRVAAIRPPYWLPQSAVTLGSGPGSPLRPQEADIDLSAIGSAVPAQQVGRDPFGLSAVIDAPAGGWVWLDRAWWPAWHTTVDGGQTSVVRALGGQLIAVPAGHHTIRQWLLPWDALIGLACGVIVVAIAAIWLGGSTALRLAGWSDSDEAPAASLLSRSPRSEAKPRSVSGPRFSPSARRPP
jgi:hypothetical protein